MRITYPCNFSAVPYQSLLVFLETHVCYNWLVKRVLFQDVFTYSPCLLQILSECVNQPCLISLVKKLVSVSLVGPYLTCNHYKRFYILLFLYIYIVHGSVHWLFNVGMCVVHVVLYFVFYLTGHKIFSESFPARLPVFWSELSYLSQDISYLDVGSLIIWLCICVWPFTTLLLLC